MAVGVRTGRDKVAGQREAPSVMTGGKIQAHALELELGVALTVATLEMISRWASNHLWLDSSAVASSLAPSGPSQIHSFIHTSI
jgi:hypothetical protein